MGQTIGFVLTGLSRGTEYWFDVQATDSSGATWTYSNPAISVIDIMPADFIHDFVAFSSNTNTCSRNTAATAMVVFAISYTTTTIGSGNLQIVLTFNELNTPHNGPTSKIQVAYGTGTAPACNSAAAGTTIGNVFTGQANAGSSVGFAQSIGFTLVGLTPGTTYGFDIQALDSTTDVWVYSNPQISVV